MHLKFMDKLFLSIAADCLRYWRPLIEFLLRLAEQGIRTVSFAFLRVRLLLPFCSSSRPQCD
jgi:hypothetical protein